MLCQRERERGVGGARAHTHTLVSFLIRTLILSDQGYTLMTSLDLTYFFIPNTATLGVGVST